MQIFPSESRIQTTDWVRSPRCTCPPNTEDIILQKYLHGGSRRETDLGPSQTPASPTKQHAFYTRKQRTNNFHELRWLENGFKIIVAETKIESLGIDTPDDLEKAKALLKI